MKTQLNLMVDFSLFPWPRFLASSFSLTKILETIQNEVTVPCDGLASYSVLAKWAEGNKLLC